MSSSRRAFVVTAAAVLGGCAGGTDEERPEPIDEASPSNEEARARADADPYRSPFVWGTWIPDVVVVNYGLGEVTATVVVRWPAWVRSSFHQRIVLPGHRPEDAPPSVMIPYIRSLGAGSILSVNTSNGVGETVLVDDDDPGIRVNLHADDVEFQYITT